MKSRLFLLTLFFLFSTISFCQTLTINDVITWSDFEELNGLNDQIGSGVTIEISDEGRLVIETLDAVICHGFININSGGTLQVFGALELLGAINVKNEAIFNILSGGSLTNHKDINVLAGGSFNLGGNGANINTGRITVDGVLTMVAGSTLGCFGFFAEDPTTSGWVGSFVINSGGAYYNSGYLTLDNAPFAQYGDTKLMDGALMKLLKQSNVLVWNGMFQSEAGSTIEFHDKTGFANIAGSTQIRGFFGFLGVSHFVYWGGVFNFLGGLKEYPKGVDVTHEAGAVIEYGCE